MGRGHRYLLLIVVCSVVAVAALLRIASPEGTSSPSPPAASSPVASSPGGAGSEVILPPPVPEGLERVEVTAVGDVEAALAFVNHLGGVVEFQSHGRIQLLLPQERLPELRQATSLVRVEPAATVVPLRDSSLALERIGADLWQEAGFSGHGVDVAVIDAGFRGFEDRLGISLPERVGTQSFRADGDIGGGTDHGLRAAEIVHQVAPGAELHLLNFSTLTEFAAAVDYAVAQQVDIVSFSLGFIHNGPGDGTGPVNEIVSRALDADVAWAVASGNWAEQHWSGFFRDTDGDSLHEFAPGVQQNEHRFNAGDLIVVSLRWEDEWGAACADYDIELFGPGGGLVRAARGIQACSGDPVETLQVLATQTGNYAVRIVEAHAESPRMLDLMVVGSPDRGFPLAISNPGGSLSQPADHPRILTVGAVTGETLSTEAPYSSRGPTTDGRPKPEVLGPTGLASEGSQPFAGTSAAAPHVAGLMALMVEAFPRSDAGALRDLVIERSVPAATTSEGSGEAMIANLGPLTGLGPLLPPGAETASLTGDLPPGGGLALVSYRGPDGYPLRFVHLLVEGQDVLGVFRLDAETQRFQVYIPGAPAFVNDLLELRSGDVIILRLAPAPQVAAGRAAWTGMAA